MKLFEKIILFFILLLTLMFAVNVSGLSVSNFGNINIKGNLNSSNITVTKNIICNATACFNLQDLNSTGGGGGGGDINDTNINITSVYISGGVAGTKTISNRPFLNSSDDDGDGIADATENISVSSQNCSLTGTCKNITDWRIGGTSISVLNMPFEGGSNATFTKDYSGFGNDIDEVIAIYNSTAGYDGFGAYEFNGTTTFLRQTFPDNMKSQNITLTAWVKTITTPFGYFVSMTPRGANSDGRGARIGMLGDGRAFFLKGALSSGSFNSTIATGNISDGNWHFIAGTYNDTTLAIFVDGVLENTFISPDGIQWNDAGTGFPLPGQLYIGATRDSAGTPDDTSANINFFNGTIDDVRIYNRTLSPQQINALWQNKTDLIVSQEILDGEMWTVNVTTTNVTTDGTSNLSNVLTIGNANPSADDITNYSLYAEGNTKILGDIEANSFITTSDERLKTNFTEFTDKLKSMENIKAGRYTLYGIDKYGVSAQDMRREFPECTTEVNGILKIKLECTQGVLFVMVKQLQQEIESIKRGEIYGEVGLWKQILDYMRQK